MQYFHTQVSDADAHTSGRLQTVTWIDFHRCFGGGFLRSYLCCTYTVSFMVFVLVFFAHLSLFLCLLLAQSWGNPGSGLDLDLRSISVICFHSLHQDGINFNNMEIGNVSFVTAPVGIGSIRSVPSHDVAGGDVNYYAVILRWSYRHLLNLNAHTASV